MKKVLLLFITIFIFGCFSNTKTDFMKKGIDSFSGPRENVILQLPDKSISRNVMLQIHRFGTREEKAKGIKDIRVRKYVDAINGKINVKIPVGIYDIFIDTGKKIYGLPNVSVKAGGGAFKISEKDVIPNTHN